MSNFTLAPWEIPPGYDIPLTAPAYTRTQVFWRGAERMMLVRVVEVRPENYLIFVREQVDPEPGSWLLTSMIRFDARTFPGAWPQVPPKFKLAHIIRKRFRLKSFWLGRALTLAPDDGSTPCYGLIHGHNHGNFWCAEPFLSRGAHFRFSNPQEMRELSAKHLRDKLAAAWHQPESEVRFAYNWARLSNAERVEHLLVSPQERAEAKLLMVYLLQAAIVLWGVSNHWEWYFWKQDPERIWLNGTDVRANLTHPLHNLIEILYEWQRLFVRHFDLFTLTDARLSYLCAAQYHDVEMDLIRVSLRIRPTAHETLEAQIKLREWLQEKAPAEIARLQFWS